jgi:hypothetical protein
MPTPRDQHEQKAVDDVQRYGLHIVHVLAEGDLPPFAYTVGLYRTFGHPEILIYGLPKDGAHRLLNHLADNLRAGKRYTVGETSDDLLDGYVCTFRLVPPAHYREHLGWASWFNESPEFPTFQLVYPDREGRWPWQDGVSEGFRRNQPVLADAPPLGPDGGAA